jgi:hypothetical protein
MKKEPRTPDPQSVFCEVCLKRVPLSEALMSEMRDGTAYFCSAGCYERWHGEHPAEPPTHDVQEGAGRSKSRDERVKHLIRQHPQRDEPKADSVERDELPPR